MLRNHTDGIRPVGGDAGRGWRTVGRPSDHVDPFLGTEIADLPPPTGLAATWTTPKPPIGNTHPGATSPFGMVSACPYSGGYPSGYGRYAPSFTEAPVSMETGNTITGFTHFHQSGTGRIGAYYNLLRVVPGDGHHRYTPVDERARPGSYACRLAETGVQCELTVSPRAAFHRYTFPTSGAGDHVTLDLSSIGLVHDDCAGDVTMAELEITGPCSARGRIAAGGPQVHFHLEWRGVDAHLWLADGRPVFGSALRLAHADPRLDRQFGLRFDVDDQVAEVRIGFSLRGTAQAEANLIADTRRAFADLVERAAQLWDGHLGRIEVLDATDDQRTVFTTALYHSLLKPADFTGENPFASDDGPVFFDISTMWDIYRTQLPLVFTLFPERGTAIVNALLGVAEREGNFPISYLLDNRPERFGRQATALAHVTVADARVRGLDGIDWSRALDLLDTTLDVGRGRVFQRDGVVTPLSHTLDLAYAHHCTAQLALALDNPVIAERCLTHADRWRNAFDPATGLLSDSEYYEGEKWNYSFRLLHDQAGRIALAGGERDYAALLDRFFGFVDDPDDEVFRFEGLNNEPDMEAPYAYLWVGRHDRTADVVRAVLDQRFGTGPGGLPGNDDSGGLSSWVVWNMLGLFPVAGQDLVLIGSPTLPASRLHLPDGELTIDTAGEGHHVRGVTVDGHELARPWLAWSDLAGARQLRFDLSPHPTGWGADDRPPSHPLDALTASR
jgi:putative alpha-1,2-mannosidase